VISVSSLEHLSSQKNSTAINSLSASSSDSHSSSFEVVSESVSDNINQFSSRESNPEIQKEIDSAHRAKLNATDDQEVHLTDDIYLGPNNSSDYNYVVKINFDS